MADASTKLHTDRPDRKVISPSDDIETERLRLVCAIQVLSAARRPYVEDGLYWLDALGTDRALVRWIQGEDEESVCLLTPEKQQALFLDEMADTHPELLEVLADTFGWAVHLVDGLIAPKCPACDGAGGVQKSVKFHSSTINGFHTCEACEGQGVLQ